MKGKLILLFVFVTAIPAQRCTTFTCDSLIVRKLLDVNGRQDVSIDDVVEKDAIGGIGSLDLSFKLIDTIIPEISNLSFSIGKINLSHNKIRHLPEELTRLDLQDIDLSNNYITILPEWIFAWHWHPSGGNCWVIYLDSNLITSIPDSLGQKASVFATFTLYWNRICNYDTTNSHWYLKGGTFLPQDCSHVSTIHEHNKEKRIAAKLITTTQQHYYDLTGRLIKQTLKSNLYSKSGVVIVKDNDGSTKVLLRKR